MGQDRQLLGHLIYEVKLIVELNSRQWIVN